MGGGETRLLLGRLDFHMPGLVGLGKVGSDSSLVSGHQLGVSHNDSDAA